MRRSVGIALRVVLWPFSQGWFLDAVQYLAQRLGHNLPARKEKTVPKWNQKAQIIGNELCL
jgi:hypothetical protein